jgi:hypothetical protein
MAGSQVCDSQESFVKEFELLSGDILRHTPTHILYQKPHTAVLRERKVVETHTTLPLKGPQWADRMSESIKI